MLRIIQQLAPAPSTGLYMYSPVASLEA